MLGVDQRLDRLERNVGREEEELERDELLRALLRGVGEQRGRR